MARALYAFISVVLFWMATPMSFAHQARSLPREVLESRLNRKPSAADNALAFSTPNGMKIQVKLNVPFQAGDQRYPVLIVFGTDKEVDPLLEKLQPESPTIIARVAYQFELPHSPLGIVDTLQLAWEFKRTVYDALWLLKRLHSVLSERLDVDPTKIIIVSSGFNTTLALAAVSKEPSYQGLVLIDMPENIPQGIKEMLIEKWEPKFGGAARPLAWIGANLAWAYFRAPAPENTLRKLNARHQILVVTTIDSSNSKTGRKTASLEKSQKLFDSSPAHIERMTINLSENPADTAFKPVLDWAEKLEQSH
jgi:hypothetical protein